MRPDKLDIAAWFGLAVGFVAWVAWVIREREIPPPHPAAISIYRNKL